MNEDVEIHPNPKVEKAGEEFQKYAKKLYREGELKRRIKRRMETAPLSSVNDIIDDVAQEWLDVEETKLPLKVNGEIDWQKTAEIMELRNLIRQKWFVKNFGESKE